MDEYVSSYRILGIRPENSWRELRAAYKSAVRKWHPDRFPQNDPERQQAEERIKEINRAYQELESYYQANGVLPPLAMERRKDPPIAPPQPAPEAAAKNYAADIEADDRVPRRTDDDPAGHTRWLPWATAAFLMFLSYILISPESKDPELMALNAPVATEPDPVGTPTLPKPADSGKYLTVGLTLDQVYALFGTPTRTEKSHETAEWHYGDAIVFFRAGRVTDWIDSPDRRLALASPSAQSPAAPPKTFQLNSTRDEVRAAQGAPLHETDTLWDYGLSQIFFQHDRVVGWHESPQHPLRIRREPPPAAPGGASAGD